MTRRYGKAASWSVVFAFILFNQNAPLCIRVNGFLYSRVPTSATKSNSRRFSSIGGGGDDSDGGPPPPNDDGLGDLGDFLDPNRKESENLQRAREFISETSLPISFDTAEEEGSAFSSKKQASDPEEENEQEIDPVSNVEEPKDSIQSALVQSFGSPTSPSSLFGSGSGDLTPDLLAKNPYMDVVSRLSPSELISKFTASANPRVQEAVRSTILGLIGSLPKMAFETTTITTGQRLASLMFQLQMTGYMFKNAEYRLSLSQSLGMSTTNPQASSFLLSGSGLDQDHEDDEDESPLSKGKVKGKLKIRVGGLFGDNTLLNDGSGKSKDDENDKDFSTEGTDKLEMEVDAEAYLSELRSEVSQLRDELSQTRQAKEEAIRKDLLLYIRTLPAQELRSLTDTMSQDVLVCMKGLGKW